jgi:hypothetical protein
MGGMSLLLRDDSLLLDGRCGFSTCVCFDGPPHVSSIRRVANELPPHYSPMLP